MGFSLRSWRRSQTTYVWGDGLVDRSLTTLWNARDWNDVGEDELVFCIPSLAAAERDAADRHGLSSFIRRALMRRLRSSIDLLSVGEPSETLDKIAACGVITAVQLESSTERDWLTQRADSKLSKRVEKDVAVWAFELSALASINRMLIDAKTQRPPLYQDAIPSVQFADALIASIHSCINGAYVYPEFALAHELLGTGAWLGVLLRGQSALMPSFVAQALTAYLGPSALASPKEPIYHLLRFYADLAGGVRPLLRRARSVEATGNPALVVGTSRSVADAANAYASNAHLFQTLVEKPANLEPEASHA